MPVVVTLQARAVKTTQTLGFQGCSVTLLEKAYSQAAPVLFDHMACESQAWQSGYMLLQSMQWPAGVPNTGSSILSRRVTTAAAPEGQWWWCLTSANASHHLTPQNEACHCPKQPARRFQAVEELQGWWCGAGGCLQHFHGGCGSRRTGSRQYEPAGCRALTRQLLYACGQIVQPRALGGSC